MATSRGLLGSSLARKYWMALTGLFLCLFLTVHLIGNLPILFGHQEDFNLYAQFMTTFPLIKVVSYGNMALLALHIVDGIVLTVQNRKARPEGYKSYKGSANASWASRSMALLGMLTLIFLIVHLKSFWFEMKFGHVPMMDIDGAQVKDLYTITTEAFHQTWYTLLYVICMIALGFHLSHGISSAFQSMGWSHPTHTPRVKLFGQAFAVLISFGFAIIPLFVWFQYLNA